MARYLVSGGAGFIGSHVVEALLRRGEQVRVLDNFSTGLRENLGIMKGCEVLEGDIRSYHIVREAVEGVDFVLHQAALPSVPRSVRDPITSNDVNVVGTLNLLTASRDARVRRLVYASSSSVYGANALLPKRETAQPEPISPYAVSKLAGEHYCQAFTELYGFETVILRYFNVFGPRQSPRSEYAAVIPRFIESILADRRPVIYGDGTQTRDFTYVANVVEANFQACQAADVIGRVFNVATGEQVSLLRLVAAIENIFGRPVAPIFEEPRAGDVKHSYASIVRAREALGYTPAVSFLDGLRLTVAAIVGESSSVASVVADETFQ
jgi:UDP-glucose 4-epimerase